MEYKRNPKQMKFSCHTCNKIIFVPRWRYKLKKKKLFYCNRNCFLKRPSTFFKCVVCGKRIRLIESNAKRSKSGKHYCSKKCKYEGISFHSRSGKKVKCKCCNNTFYKPKHSLRKYCSFRCRSYDPEYRQKISETKDRKVKINCAECKRDIKVHRYRVQKSQNLFCSIHCRALYSRGKISKKRNGKEVNCSYCGKLVYRAKYRLEKYNCWFCSMECMNKQTTQFLVRPTKPEKMFMKLIKEFDLPYNYVGDGKFWIGNLNPDFIHKNSKKVVEIFGDYWHNPKLNKNCKKKNTEKGRKKAFKKRGYVCTVIWEKDFNSRNWKEYVLKKIGGKNAAICST